MNLNYPVDTLISYYEDPTGAHVQRLADAGRFRVIGDSGAFTAYTKGAAIDLAAYAEWVTRWRPCLFWAAALDVLGDPHTSHRNWLTLRNHGVNTVPTIHVGADARWVDVYAAEGVDFIGLGGGAFELAAYPWCVHVFQYTARRHPHVRFHGWGTARLKHLTNLPYYSVDSTGIAAKVYRYGEAAFFNPETKRTVHFPLDGRAPYRHGSWLRRWYGVEPVEIERSHYGNRDLLVALATASTQRLAAWLQARHQVTPPTYAINPDAPVGTLVHLVYGKDDARRVAPTPQPMEGEAS